MHLNWSTLALQTVNFAVLVWLLHRFLYQPVLGMIEARRAEVAQQYADASTAQAHADAAEVAMKAERTSVATERAATLKSAAIEAEHAATARRARAEADAADLLAATRRTLASERAVALADARRLALDLGVDIARRLVADIPTERRAEVWLERVERHLAGLTEAERDEVRRGLNGDGSIRVVSAVPLPAPVAEAFRARLRHALGDGAEVLFGVDESLVAGVELHLPQVILRFSWRALLASMRAEIESHENGAPGNGVHDDAR